MMKICLVDLPQCFYYSIEIMLKKAPLTFFLKKNIKIFLKAFTPYDNHEDQIKFPKLAVLKKINRAINFSKSLSDQAPF